MAAQKVTPEVFRSVFKVVDKEALHWFPGHMDRGLKQMQQRLRTVDCIIEVHDARVPLSGRNTNFKYTISGVKPHILVLNKVDLINTKHIGKIRERLEGEYPNLIFTNCKDQQCRGVRQVFPLAQELINKSDRYNRSGEEDFCVMIIGVPNVGKSSLVNSLRNRHLHKSGASHVGASPGITRSVLHKIKMCEKPLFYMLDTPGILTPKVPDTETGLKLAACNTIQDHLVGEVVIADYLLYWMNKNGFSRYVKYFQLERASDNILEVLAEICVRNKKMLRFRDPGQNDYVVRPDLNLGAKLMIKAFRNGELGKIMLDADLL